MNRVSKVLFIAAASLAMTGTALAQEPPADPPAEGEGETAPPAEGEAGAEGGAAVGAEVGTDGAKVDAAPEGGMYTSATWPLANIDRPLNAAKGMIEIKPSIEMGYTAGDDDAMIDSETAFSLGVGARYGITDKIEALFSFDRIALSPTPVDEMGEDANGDRIKGVLTIGAGFGLTQGAAGGKFDSEAKAAFQYDLLGEVGFLLAGVDVRYKLGPKMWVGTPINEPGLIITVVSPETMGMSFKPMFLNIPAAFGFQATPKLHLQANLQLLTWNINEDAQLLANVQTGGTPGEKKAVTLVGADVTNVEVKSIFALSNTMDVRVDLDLGDLNNAGDFFGLLAGVSLRL